MPYDDEAYARLAGKLLDTEAFPHNAEQIVRFAQETLDIDYAGITLIRSGGQLQTTCASAALVEDVDRWQYELDEGPCRDSAWEQHTLICQDLSTDSRWPEWAPKVVALGIRSVLSVEMVARQRRLGALNLYSLAPRSYDDQDVAFAHLFARHAAVALATVDHEANLATALDARTLIGQAQGILMERFGLDADQAFEVLKRYSQDRNIKLRVVAEHLVASRRLPGGGERKPEKAE